MLHFPSNQVVTGLVIFLLNISNTWAASFTVSPVIAQLTEQQAITSFTIKNQAATPTAIELQLFRWQQIDGEERLTPAPELLVTPTIFKVPGNASQIIRVGMRQPISTELEQAYRLILKEIPGLPKPGFQGLNVLLRISIPIFVSKNIGAPTLNWRASTGDDDKLILDIDNTGSGHTKLLHISLQADSQTTPLNIKRQVYLLAGDHLRLATDLSVKPGMELQLVANTSKGQVKTRLRVE